MRMCSRWSIEASFLGEFSNCPYRTPVTWAMSLHDDVQLAQRLLDEPLSKPTEKEARAAARRVLEAVGKDLSASWDQSNLTTAGIITFLRCLSKAIDPDSVPKVARRIHTRAIDFRDVTKATRAAFPRQLDIAIQVYLLNKTGKNGTSLVAKKYNMDSSEISRICTAPDIKWAVATWFKGLTASEAAEWLERGAQKETS
jgi:hypothetical protein